MSALRQRITQPDMAGLPDWQIADILNRPDPTLPEVVSTERTMVGTLDVMACLGPDEGAAFLDQLKAAGQVMPRLRYAWSAVVELGGINVADPLVRLSITALSATDPPLLSASQAAALLALAERRRRPSWAEHHQIAVTPATVGQARQEED